MKKTVLTFALCSMFGLSAAFAAPIAQDQSEAQPQNQEQGRHHRTMDPNKRVQFLAKKLNLTQDQQNQILPILTNEQQQMQSLRSDTSLSREDRFAKMRSIREDSRTKIEGVLTADQKQAFEKMQQQGRAHYEHGGNSTNQQ